jgi:hypothetical protein
VDTTLSLPRPQAYSRDHGKSQIVYTRAWWVFRRAVDGVRAGHASVNRKPSERFPQRIATTSVWAWVPPCATYHLRLLVRHGGHFARAELQAAQQQPGLLGAEPRVRLGPRKIKRKKFLP